MAHHIVDLRLRPECSFEEAVRHCHILQKLSQESGFLFLYWSSWVEDRSQVQLLFGWQNSITPDRMSALQNTILHHLEPLQPFLAPHSGLDICTISAFFRTYFEGKLTSVLTFSFPLHVSEQIRDVPFALSALLFNSMERGSAYVPTDADEKKTWEQQVRSACRGFEAGWVETSSHVESPESRINDTNVNGQDVRTYKAIVTWESSELEAAFKARPSRHGYLNLTGSMRGLELHGIDLIHGKQQEQQPGDSPEDHPSYRTEDIWKPIVETWAAAGFEEHHCVFKRLSTAKATP